MAAQVKEHTLETLTVGHVERMDVCVTPEQVVKFAELSGDISPLHVDSAFAQSRGFGGCVAHGMLMGAYISALIGTCLPGRHGIMKNCELVFRAPLIPPETLTITGTVMQISQSTGQVTIEVTVTDSTGKVLVTGKVKSLIRSTGEP